MVTVAVRVAAVIPVVSISRIRRFFIEIALPEDDKFHSYFGTTLRSPPSNSATNLTFEPAFTGVDGPVSRKVGQLFCARESDIKQPETKTTTAKALSTPDLMLL